MNYKQIMRRILSMIITMLFATTVLMTGCTKAGESAGESGESTESGDISNGISQFVGEWDCAESALEDSDTYTGFYALDIEADGEFSLYDQEAGNPGLAGTLTVDSDSEITLECQEEDFDPPAGWSEMGQTQTLQYEFESDDELHLIYGAGESTWTLVFYKLATDEDELDGEADSDAPIGNPWTYTEDASEAETQAGVSLNLPNGASDVMYGVLTTDQNGDGEYEKMLEMSYVAEDGEQITARVMPTGEFTDISGMDATTTTWDNEEDCTVSGLDATLKICKDDGDGSEIKLITWFDVVPGISYSVMATGTDLDGIDPVALAESVYEPMQGED